MPEARHEHEHEHGPEDGGGVAAAKAPMFLEELVQEIRPRDAIEKMDAADTQLDIEFFVAAHEEPRIDVVAERMKGAEVRCEEDDDGDGYLVKVKIANQILGAVVEPPKVKLERFVDEYDIREAQRRGAELDGKAPAHLPLRPLPQRVVDPYLRLKRQLDDGTIRDEDRIYEATTIFGADNRYTFRDTAYPWSTTGRVTSPLGSASGAMVGPRHLLTCSHVVQWLPDNVAGWIRFAPAFYDGSEPFGAAWGTRIYWESQKVFGPTISRDEAQHDYVCVVLDRRIGDVTGWMGSRGWSDSWDGGAYWSHIGYPGDLGGQRPSFQNGVALDGSFWDREVHTRIFHKADVWRGQSGGPFFGWWSGESFPRIVADQSAQNSDENIASGGAHMVNCIIRARNDHP